jgi:hypothetical protein
MVSAKQECDKKNEENSRQIPAETQGFAGMSWRKTRICHGNVNGYTMRSRKFLADMRNNLLLFIGVKRD